VSQSEEISRAFYAQLGAEGRAARTRPEWDEKIVAARRVAAARRARARRGCGYGRIALPLARAGHAIDGLDLSEGLIDAARRSAAASAAQCSFTTGSMTSLPYPAESFAAVICLWSAFHELLAVGEQTRAIGELARVL
jgi:SAM-dependent methyltransferase